MEDTFIKAYDSIMREKELDLYESFLLCRYINKYTRYETIIVSDTEDAKYLKIDRKYVGKKRKRLKELGYIDYTSKKGQPTEVKLDKSVLEFLGIK